mgnify:CR=1 FL=1
MFFRCTAKQNFAEVYKENAKGVIAQSIGF